LRLRAPRSLRRLEILSEMRSIRRPPGKALRYPLSGPAFGARGPIHPSINLTGFAAAY
jgi:hypothetical protein